MPELAVSAPIFSMSKKKAIGVLVNTIRLSELNKMLSGKYQMEDQSILWDKERWKSIKVYLVNRDKRMITNSVSVHPPPSPLPPLRLRSGQAGAGENVSSPVPLTEGEKGGGGGQVGVPNCYQIPYL